MWLTRNHASSVEECEVDGCYKAEKSYGMIPVQRLIAKQQMSYHGKH